MASARDQSEMKMLPGMGGEIVAPSTGVIPSNAPARQLSELPREELEHLAEEYGLDPHDYKSRQHLVSAIHDRRQMIAAMDREAMLDVIKWGRRPVTVNATKEQIGQEIVRIKSMRFSGLSQRGLVVLARMRGVRASESEPIPALIRKLKRQEGFFARMNRKRRSMIGSIVSNMLGEEETAAYQFLPADETTPRAGTSSTVTSPPPKTVKQEIEEQGLIGGLAERMKKSADAYVNTKLDEIESRIDRKLDEIDRRLAEWRDKEVANRLKILKITLWASVIVGAFSLIYSYIVVNFVNPPPKVTTPPPVQTTR